MMHARVPFLLLLVLVAAVSPALEAQQRPPSRFAAAHPAPLSPALPSLPQVSAEDTGVMVAGGILLGAVGLFGGAMAGALVERLSVERCGDLCGLAGALYGAVVGEALGVGTGVHVGNSGRGSLLADIGISLAIGTAGAAGALIAQDPIVLAVVPIAQLVGTIAVERSLTEERER